MKIHCDVCDKDEASVFCVADEAALCAACDHRVHHANKLAGKHQRFSLHHPSPKQAPLCDVCQEKRAFLFCQQDRAILCKDCDFQIHKSNEHTQRHTRFLLTGVKLSLTATLYSPDSQLSDAVPSIKENPVLVSQTKGARTSSKHKSAQTAAAASLGPRDNGSDCLVNSAVSGSSSISEYLMEMVPAWHVDDFFDSSFPSSPHGFCKNGDNIDVDHVMPFWDADLEGSHMNGFPNEKMGLWVPQAAPPLLNQAQNQSYQSMEFDFGAPNLAKEQEIVFNNSNVKGSRKWSEDTSFLVPQIEPHSSASTKRLRTSW